jgi:hypothetical protein
MDFLDELFAPLAAEVGPGLTNVLIALLVLGIGYVVAKLVERVVAALLRRTNLDNRLARSMGSTPTQEPSVEQAIARLVFYLIMLFVLLAVFQRLNWTFITEPLNLLVTQIVDFLPNLIAAAIILVVGYLLARVLRGLVTNLAAGLGAERLGRRIGLNLSLSRLTGTIVYALILIPTIIAALNALDIEAVSQPAAAMLQTLLDAIPRLFGAGLLLVIAYFVGRVVADIVRDLLAGLGFDGFVARLGLYSATTGVTTRRTPSQIAGLLVLVAIMLFAAMEAANLLGFETLAVLLAEVIAFAGRLLLALLIFAVGLYLANLARNVIAASGNRYAGLLAHIARWAVIIFAGAIALRELGVANTIINLAFGLLLGAIAVAAALAFGLGSRELAGREAERLLQEARTNPPPPPAPTPPAPPLGPAPPTIPTPPAGTPPPAPESPGEGI